MEYNKVSNTLAGFKRLLSEAKEKNILIQTELISVNGQLDRIKEPAPVGKLQSNSFSICRDGVDYWTEFDKSDRWVFNLSEGKATKLIGNNRLIFTFKING